MSRGHSYLALLCWTLLLASSVAAQQSSIAASVDVPDHDRVLTIRKTVDEVHLTFTVTDHKNLPLMGVRLDQITLFDEARPVDRVVDFSANAELPLRLAILLDASDSVAVHLADEQSVAVRFLERLLRPRQDRAYLTIFSDAGDVVPVASAQDADWANTVETRHVRGWSTALYDAVIDSSERMAQSEPDLSRRAIVILSDGEDTISRHSLRDVIESVQQADVPVYAVTIHNRWRKYPGDRVLQTIADTSGGSLFVISQPDELTGALVRIEQQLRSQYSIVFQPFEVENGRCHHVEVKVHGAGVVRVNSRGGYCVPQ
jgi:VWFA-related protein